MYFKICPKRRRRNEIELNCSVVKFLGSKPEMEESRVHFSRLESRRRESYRAHRTFILACRCYNRREDNVRNGPQYLYHNNTESKGRVSGLAKTKVF